MDSQKVFTRKELQRITGAPSYTIAYLNDCGRLPVVHQSKGPGYPTLYHPDCVQIINEHLKKQSNGLEHEE